MSTERDTHFQGSAKHLVPKILQMVAPYTDGASLYCDECVAYLHPDLERLIAQYTYDLVWETIGHIDFSEGLKIGDFKPRPEDIPDLTAWPTPKPPEP